jgi:dTDP-D-glucose 4,6-dehydratase
VYGEALAANMAENSILEPTNPYSASKAAAEMMVKGYVKSHGLLAVMIRLNNVMGPHQVRTPDMLK